MKEKNIKKNITTYQAENEKILPKMKAAFKFAHDIGGFLNNRIFNKKYKTPLKKFVLTFDNFGALAKYKKKSRYGFSNLIDINISIIKNNTMLAAVLFHEMVHEYQDLYDPRPTRTPYYHDIRFRQISEDYVPVCEKGRFIGITENLADLLEDFPLMDTVDRELIIGSELLKELLIKPKPAGKKKQTTRMKKWSCNCPVNIRCAVQLDATCNICGHPFKKAEKLDT